MSMQAPTSVATVTLVTVTSAVLLLPSAAHAKPAKAPPATRMVVTETDCTVERLGTSIAPEMIGEPVSAVTLTQVAWVAAAGANPAYCQVTGAMTPIDSAAPNINFRVAMPSRWTYRYAQLGGGGMNGSIPGLTGGEGGSYLSLLDRMGRAQVDGFARLYVTPMTGHGLTGNNYNVNGDGVSIPSAAIPSSFDRVQAIVDWVENGIAPPNSATVTSSTKSLPLCSYPAYPRYLGGGLPTTVASSYTCATD
jgi:hypothetical protein